MEQLSLFSEQAEFKGIPIHYPYIIFKETEHTDHYKVFYKRKPLFIFIIYETGDTKRPINIGTETLSNQRFSSFGVWGEYWLAEQILNRHIKREIERLEGV